MKKNLLGMAATLALVLSASAFAGPVWMAHRGGRVEADENTLKSYRIAAQYGVDLVECDPRLSGDGVFVAMHDSTVDRTTNGRGKVAEMTLPEIKSLRTRGGEQVPTIQEILEFAKGAGVMVYLDTKEQKDIGHLEKLMALVRENGMTGRVVVGLWNNRQLEWMHEHHPEITTCISWPWPIQSLAHAKKRGATWVGTELWLASGPMIKSAHQHGLKVVTMPVNDAETARRKINQGMDIIQTDDPGLRLQFEPRD